MGQDPSADGASVTKTREPEEIRAEIHVPRTKRGTS
jgi:hypothetical protein